MNTNNIKTGLIKIPGALTSTGGDGNGQVGGVVAYTGDIYDVALGKNQAAINNDFVEALSGINDDISDVQDDISGLAPIATSGSFNDLIDNPFVVFDSQYIKQINLDGLWRVSFGFQNQVNDYNTNAFGTHITLNYPGTAVGQYNHPTDYALLTVGIGSNNSSRKNGFVVDTAGNIYAYGINGYDGTNVIHPGTGQYSLTQFVNNLDSRATSLQNTINASSTAWSNLAPATNVTLAAITGLNATNAQDAFSEINTVIAPLRTGSISSTLVSDTNFNTTQDQINLSVPYDISAANSFAEYTDLEDALGSNGSNIPQNLRVGGLTVKFVNSDTGEYEQWRLKSSSWNTNISDWALDIDGSIADGKLKLPFELENPNGVVTQANQIGMDGKPLDRAVPSNKDNVGNASDFDISDEQGNVLVQFADGGIQTKDFNSKETPKQGKSGADLDIADEQGNVLAQFSNGELKTKNFDSKETPKQGKSASDFDIRDSQGNVLVQFVNGHIKTQNFDSQNIESSPSPTPTPTPSTGFTLTQIY